MAIDWKSAYAGLQFSGLAEFPPACLHYLLQIVRTAPPGAGGKGSSPKELTMYFRRQSRQDFGPLSPMVLQEWGMIGPAEFGRGLLLLGRQGCINLDPTDSADSFSGGDDGPFFNV